MKDDVDALETTLKALADEMVELELKLQAVSSHHAMLLQQVNEAAELERRLTAQMADCVDRRRKIMTLIEFRAKTDMHVRSQGLDDVASAAPIEFIGTRLENDVVIAHGLELDGSGEMAESYNDVDELQNVVEGFDDDCESSELSVVSVEKYIADVTQDSVISCSVRSISITSPGLFAQTQALTAALDDPKITSTMPRKGSISDEPRHISEESASIETVQQVRPARKKRVRQAEPKPRSWWLLQLQGLLETKQESTEDGSRTSGYHKSSLNDEDSCVVCGVVCPGGSGCAVCRQLVSHLVFEDITAAPPESRQFACSQCAWRFETPRQLLLHLRRHTGYRPHTCERCGKSFGTLVALRGHAAWHDGTNKPFLCEHCPARSLSAASLAIHQRVHTGERPFGCGECGKHFCTLYLLKVHMRRHTGERPYACRQCGVGYTTTNQLKSHMSAAHSEEHKYMCYVCCKRLKSKATLRKHVLSHVSDEEEMAAYECGTCGVQKKSGAALSRHIMLSHQTDMQEKPSLQNDDC